MLKLPLLLLLLAITLFAQPSWFYNEKPTSKNEIIGYGVDNKLSQAKQNAIAEIVKTISVEVDTSTYISKSEIYGNYKKDTSSKLSTKAKATLSGVKVLKVEELDGKWYVASSYDNSPIEQKIKKLLPKHLSNETQNIYLKNTRLFKNLNDAIGVDLNYKILRKDNLWQIKYKQIILPLKQDQFYKLFSNQSNKIVKLKANQKTYRQNDQMYFDIKLSKRGYISILYVEHDGKVGVLTANKLENKNFTYPDLKSEDTFTVVNPYGKTIKELYVVLYSKNMIDLSQFENVSENLLDESNYNFDKLLDKLDSVEFSTFNIKIKK